MSRCIVLMYHVIDRPRADSEAQFCCAPDAFREQMRHLSDSGWHVISLHQLVTALRGGEPLPERSVVITFDDGTACTSERALPILAEFGHAATVFVVSGLVDGENDWMKAQGQPARRMLTVRQVRELAAAGIEIGSHTDRHVWLARVPLAEAAQELRASKERLEDMIGKPVRYLAYPYGNFNADIQLAAREAGYEAACATRPGRNRAGADLWALKRVEVMGSDSVLQFRLKLHSGTHDMPPWSLPRAAVKRALVGMHLIADRART